MKTGGVEIVTPTTLSVVVPCFNEEATIESILAKILAADTIGMNLEVIVVDDGSTDRSQEAVSRVARSDPRVKLVKRERNHGKGAAIRAGILAASGDIILMQDADLEYEPAEYPSSVGLRCGVACALMTASDESAVGPRART
jgi:glycosyltransferase involved in cell wall biosynthesis